MKGGRLSPAFLYLMLHHLQNENKKNLNDTDCESLLLHLYHLGFACFRSNNPDGSLYLFCRYTLALDLWDVNAFIFLLLQYADNFFQE
ncbi:hypothetical protein CJU60_01030 [Bacillus sp. 7705b]|nr:hypothetical protein CJU60_01030 [Bacillus sp. 7705b]